MRKSDKKLNIIKSNILTEQRYIQRKMGLSENIDIDVNDDDEDVEEVDESLVRVADTSNNSKTSDPTKKVVGHGNANAIKKVANDPYKVMKALNAQPTYSEGEEEIETPKWDLDIKGKFRQLEPKDVEGKIEFLKEVESYVQELRYIIQQESGKV